jgi:hypothetical protein
MNTQDNTKEGELREKREVPKHIQNELHAKTEPYIDKMIEAYKREGMDICRFSLQSMGLQCAAIGYYHLADQQQPTPIEVLGKDDSSISQSLPSNIDDDTFNPVPDSEAFTPGEWQIYCSVIAVNNGYDDVCEVYSTKDRNLIAQAKNMHRLLKAVSKMDNSLFYPGLHEEIIQVLNNCKPNP